MGNTLNATVTNQIKNKVFRNWILFNSFTLFWVIIIIPALYLFERGILFFVALFVTFILAYLITGVQFKVAETNPTSFLKVENLNKLVSKIHWRFIYPATVILFILYYYLPFKYPDIAAQIAPAFIPAFISFGFVFMGTTIYQIGIIGNIRQQPKLLKARAEAYFRVTATSLENPSLSKNGRLTSYFLRVFLNRKSESVEQRKKLVKIFENGMIDLNTLLIHQYNVEFCNLRKYIDYFHYVVCLKRCPETDRVRRAIDLMGYGLSKKIEFSEIILTARQMLEEKPSMTNDEAFQDLDFKTGINRWYHHNKESFQLSLLIIPIIISIMALLFFHSV